jgi:very-short-patch-repair endonuclease
MDLVPLFPPYRQGLSNCTQLNAQGFTSDHISEARYLKQIVRVRRGVYSTEPLPPVAEHLISNGILDLGYLARMRSVLLEVGDRAMLGARSAALAWGWELLVEPSGTELAIKPGGYTKRDDVTYTQLVWGERTTLRVRGLDPVPVLSAVDTVLHCAITLPMREAVTVADSAMRAKTVTLKQLKDAARAHHGKKGYRRMRRVLDWSDPKCGSVLESAFRVLVLEAGILRPESQFRIGKHRVDFCWKGLRIVVEVDGRRFHDPEDARNRDDRRNHDLVSAHWTLLRFTWAQVVHDPEYVLGVLRATLGGVAQAA